MQQAVAIVPEAAHRRNRESRKCPSRNKELLQYQEKLQQSDKTGPQPDLNCQHGEQPENDAYHGDDTASPTMHPKVSYEPCNYVCNPYQAKGVDKDSE